jgi:lysophospholipase L1-like esterase
MAPLKLICLGDSITGTSNLERFCKFSHIVDCMLEASLGPGQAVVLNRGIGGNSTTDVVGRLHADVVDEHPDIVVLLIGGNDRKDTDEQRATTRRNLHQIIATLQAAGSKVLVLQYHVLVNPQSPETAWIHLDDNNELIAAVATELNAPLLDMGPHMHGALAHYALPELVSSTDGVHLNPGGELVFARAIFGRLRELGWLG